MELVKSRVYQYAQARNVNLPVFAMRIFGSHEFFQKTEKITVQQIIDLAAMCPELNMNWILNGRGNMIMTDNEILIEALEDELAAQKKEIEKLKSPKASSGI